ncbi:copper-binding protein [Actomonas aquatica]|uniref:Copper-binding protein n=1 Tax=Actomonas aquatica TaxID=2866162 RepID=A0ABZ1C5V6_9BACT|nr:copper-binding protein [Opitutus sp. WL0086]WRQ86866.1 copper-binding protein [Opitutus sp. WL0086]
MKLLPLLRLALLLVAPLWAQPVRFDALQLDAAPGSTAPQLASAYDGSLYASWVEPTTDGGHALRITRFDREADAWLAPGTVASGSNWFINSADTPSVAAGLRGKVAAVWFERGDGDAHSHAYHAVYATSDNHGQTWSPPAPLSIESHVTEFATITPLINGKWLAVWLDGRAHTDGGPMQLRSRLLGSDEPDTLIDDRVCDCCSLATTVLPNGSVLLAYRDRSDDEVRDIAYRRYSRGAWTEATAPTSDGWTINACPVNGPALSRRGAHVAAAWFTAADGEPVVKTARSNNIGRSWNLVGPVSDPDARPIGRASVAVTRDGSQWVGWVEAPGTYALRRVDAEGVMHAIDRLPLPPSEASAAPHDRPRMTLLDNRSDQPARLLILRPEPTGVASYIATLPLEEGAAVDDCGCGPQEDTSRGHAMRGRIEKVMTERNALLVAHEEVPGVMKAMTMQFSVDPRVIPLVADGQEIMARMERRDDGKWWLFNIRLLKAAN